MERMRLYRDRASFYDRIYHFKDYAAETEQLVALLSAQGIGPGSFVVEAACGTGAFLVHLQEHYRIAGFDVHEAVLALARDKLGDDAELWQADMRDFELSRPADALLCLFSSIGYVHPVEQLARALGAFHRALRPGGVLVIEPFLTPDKFQLGHGAIQTYQGEDLQLARAAVAEQDGRLSIFDFHWLAVRHGQPVEHFCERHELWLYTHDETRAALRAAGFEPHLEDEGLGPQRGLWRATKLEQTA
jgi:daunosaminyl-N,N-dimethyltransferase/N-dimethyltransferase